MTGAQIAAMARTRGSVLPRPSTASRIADLAFRAVMYLSIAVGFLGLGAILFDVARDGLPRLSMDFITNFPSRIIPSARASSPRSSGRSTSMAICAVLVVPRGVATAVYLEEYADCRKWFNRLIEVTSRTSRPCLPWSTASSGWFIVRGPLSMGRVLLAGGITLSLLVLPVVIIVAREAIRRPAVDPRGLDGARGDPVADDLEAGPAGLDRRHRNGRDPRALRAIGETAPLLIIGAAVFSALQPSGLFDSSRRSRSRSSAGRRTPTGSS